MPTLHLHIVDDSNLHVPRALVTVKGFVAITKIDFAGTSGSKGTVSVDFGALTSGNVAVKVEVTSKEGKTASLDINDSVAPLVRPDISYTVTVPGAKGSKWAQFQAELEAAVGDHKTEAVGVVVLGGLGAAWYFARRERERESKRQEMMMMMAMSRAPPEVAKATLAAGVKTAKKAVVAAARPMKMLKASFKKVNK